MKGLEVGGLALIVNSQAAENIGRTVRLIAELRAGESGKTSEGYTYRVSRHSWLVESASGDDLIISWPALRGREGVCRSVWLMPLNGDEDPVLARVEERQHA